MKGKLLLLLATLLIMGCSQNDQPSHPNIIIVLADDMGYGDPGCYNPESKIPTPNIDQLAKEGLLFTNAHSPGNWCTPSRYGLLTGQYPHRVAINKMHETCLIKQDQISIQSLLKSAGYTTAGIGKWHLGFKDAGDPNYTASIEEGPVDRGFDHYFGIYASLDIPPYYFMSDKDFVSPPNDSIGDNYTEGWTKVQGEFWRGGGISSDFKHEEVLPLFTQKSIEFIDEHVAKNPSDPFFLYFALPAPHTPWLPTSKFNGSSGAGLYGDFTVMVDDIMGQLKKTLVNNNIHDNTIVVFTSDNGPVWFDQDKNKYNHDATPNLRGLKADLWEGASRVPFIVSWPEKIKPGTTHELLNFTDLLATIADVVEVDISNEDLDSENLTGLLFGDRGRSSGRDETVVATNTLIQGDWKYIEGNASGWLLRNFNVFDSIPPDMSDTIGLYNLIDDPSESRNLAGEYPERVREMQLRLQQLKANPQ